MDMPVMIRRMAKRMKDERYRRTITPNTKVGLRSAMAVVNQFAPFGLVSRRENEDNQRWPGCYTAIGGDQKKDAIDNPSDSSHKKERCCCLLQPIQPWRAE